MAHLVGTPLLRAYMHGFFLHNKLWHKARAVAGGDDYEAVRRQRIAAKLDADRASRITVRKRLPKALILLRCSASD